VTLDVLPLFALNFLDNLECGEIKNPLLKGTKVKYTPQWPILQGIVIAVKNLHSLQNR